MQSFFFFFFFFFFKMLAPFPEVLFFLIQSFFFNSIDTTHVYIVQNKPSFPVFLFAFPLQSLIRVRSSSFFCSSSGSNLSVTLSYAFAVHCLVLRDLLGPLPCLTRFTWSTALSYVFTVHKRKKNRRDSNRGTPAP